MINFIRSYVRTIVGLLIFLIGGSVLLYKISGGQLSKSLSFDITLYGTGAVIFLYIVWLLWPRR
jgi:hypothetical protein